MRLNIVDLKDRAEILDCLVRCAQGLDQRDWQLYASAFADEALVEVPSYLAAPVSAAAFRNMLREKFDPNRYSGQHFLGNTHFAIDGDTARIVTEFIAVNLQKGRSAGMAIREVSAGLYIDELSRGTEGWGITRHIIVRKNQNLDETSFLSPFADAILQTLTKGYRLAI